MIYLDNCATTKMREEVAKEMFEYERKSFANPSSLHSFGMKCEKDITNIRKEIANIMKVSEEEIFFTASGTESNNIGIKGVIEKFGNRKKHILASPVEHSSVFQQMNFFKERGFEVEFLNVDSEGRVNPEEVKEKLKPETALVSVMQVNNEVGTIQPIKEIGSILKSSEVVFHVDGLQGFMKVLIELKSSNVKLYSAGSHKIYGPKGVGLLFVDKSLKIPSLMQGGGQERGLRSGTENVPGIIGFGRAIEIMKENFAEETAYAKKLKDRMWENLSEIENIIKITPENSSPYILTIAFKNVPGEVLLHCLEQDEIFVSTASACTGHKKSRVIEAMNIENDYAKGVIRMCVSYETSTEDIDFASAKIKKYVKEIRENTI